MIVLYIVAAILAIMGIVILMGKGDNLIAGYASAWFGWRIADHSGPFDIHFAGRRDDDGYVVICRTYLCSVYYCCDFSEHVGEKEIQLNSHFRI